MTGVNFSAVTSWIFDLDNTLYPPRVNLFAQVDVRITLWLAHHYGIDGMSARLYQKRLFELYGTTLNGLLLEDKIDTAAYLSFVHDIDYTALQANPRLNEALQNLRGEKYILTNGSLHHAEQVLARLDIRSHFTALFDIAAAQFQPKPNRENYDLFLERFQLNPRRCAFFEDLARNLDVPHRLGMRTVLVDSPTYDGDTREAWEINQAHNPAPHVDAVTDDLPSFLLSLSSS